MIDHIAYLNELLVALQTFKYLIPSISFLVLDCYLAIAFALIYNRFRLCQALATRINVRFLSYLLLLFGRFFLDNCALIPVRNDLRRFKASLCSLVSLRFFHVRIIRFGGGIFIGKKFFRCLFKVTCAFSDLLL